jgi:hypothetical protein
LPKLFLLFLLLLGFQSFELRAELVFRSLEQVNGQQRWSAIKKYSNPVDITYAQDAAGVASPADEVRVFVTGEIVREDEVGAATLARLIQSGRQVISGNTVWLASHGGDIDAAMALGRVLRRFGAFTLVGRDDQCLSACVFAFMGGERRIVAGRLGIHRPFFPSTQADPERQVRFRQLQKTLRDYIEELDFPPSLYEAVMVVPPESMKLLAPAELKRFTLEGISPSSEDIADAASARRLQLSMSDYLLHKPKGSACPFFVAGQGRCEAKAPAAPASPGAADNAGTTTKAATVPPGGVLGMGKGQKARR